MKWNTFTQLLLSIVIAWVIVYCIDPNRPDLDKMILDAVSACRIKEFIGQFSNLKPAPELLLYQEGNKYINDRNFDKAIEAFNRSIALNNSLGETYLGRGMAYMGKEDADKAMKDLNRAIKLDPSLAMAYRCRASVYYNRAVNYYDKDDLNKAIDNYKNALDDCKRAKSFGINMDKEIARLQGAIRDTENFGRLKKAKY